MKSLLLPLLLLSLPSLADGGSLVTRSAGKYLSDESRVLDVELASRPAITSHALVRPRLSYGSSEPVPGPADTQVQARVAAHPGSVSFEIFDAWVELSGDRDSDGFYHRLNVVFDADTSAALETVYVKLYLSRDGGDWIQYTTSDLFEISFDASADTYEVVTELIEGYPPGYYDVLVELHSLSHPEIVASRIVDASAGLVITLEDVRHDDVSGALVVDDSHVHVAGSMSLPGMILLALLVWLKLRYFSARASTRLSEKKPQGFTGRVG